MIPFPILAFETDPCELVEAGTLEEELAIRLIAMARLFYDGRINLSLISGYRTVDEQIALGEEGRPAADPSRSNHCVCPSRAADLWPELAITGDVKAEFGRACVMAGLRWGGGSPVDPNTGIPSDWNHVDLGRRPS